MKNIIFLLTFISLCVNCKAQQQILPLETKGWSSGNVYYKDLNNDLEPYVGTWKGTFDNKTFTISFLKNKSYNSMGNYFKDRLLGRYNMKDSNGNQLYSTYNLPDDDVKITSLGFVNSMTKDKLRFIFLDACIEGEIHLNFENAQKTQMHWQYFTNQTLVGDDSGCATINEMPRGEMTLIKQ